MGEYADDEIDRWIGDCSWGRRRRRTPVKPTCQYCGATNLQWQQVKGGKWRLHDARGALHVCKSTGIPADPSEFPYLD